MTPTSQVGCSGRERARWRRASRRAGAGSHAHSRHRRSGRDATAGRSSRSEDCQRSRRSPCASEEPASAAEVARPHRDDAHLARRVRRLDHPSAADVHRHMPDDRVLVEEEVARQELRHRDRLARGELRVGVARDRDPVRTVDGPGESRAVVTPGREPTPEVVKAEERSAVRTRSARVCGNGRVAAAGSAPAGTWVANPTSVPFGSVAVRAVTSTVLPATAGPSCHERTQPGVAARVERRGLVGHRDLRPAGSLGEHAHRLPVEDLGRHVADEREPLGIRHRRGRPDPRVEGQVPGVRRRPDVRHRDAHRRCRSGPA